MKALVAPLSLTKKISSASSVESPLMVTEARCEVTPGLNVTVPVAET